MAKFFVFVIIAVLALQSWVQGKPAQKSQIEVAGNELKTLTDNISKSLGLQDITSEKVLKTINDQAKAFADNLNTIKTQVDKEIKAHEGDTKKALKEFEDRVTATIENIAKIVDPEKKIQKTGEEVRKQFDASFKTVSESFEKFLKNVKPNVQEFEEKTQKLSKTIEQSLTETGNEILTKLKKTYDDHQKTHKH